MIALSIDVASPRPHPSLAPGQPLPAVSTNAINTASSSTDPATTAHGTERAVDILSPASTSATPPAANQPCPIAAPEPHGCAEDRQTYLPAPQKTPPPPPTPACLGRADAAPSAGAVDAPSLPRAIATPPDHYDVLLPDLPLVAAFATVVGRRELHLFPIGSSFDGVQLHSRKSSHGLQLDARALTVVP